MKTASFWKIEEALTEERTLDGVREVTYIPYDGFFFPRGCLSYRCLWCDANKTEPRSTYSSKFLYVRLQYFDRLNYIHMNVLH